VIKKPAAVRSGAGFIGHKAVQLWCISVIFSTGLGLMKSKGRRGNAGGSRARNDGEAIL
jgi:hypothetical protein